MLKIGDNHFKLVSTDESLVVQTESAFVEVATAEKVDYTLIDLDTTNEFEICGQPPITDHPNSAIKRVISTAQNIHEHRDLFLDACALLTPDQTSILILGRSQHGKTTLSVALALQQGWKLLSEDLVFIDIKHDRIVSFVSPLSLRPGAPALIKASTGIAPAPICFDRWLVRPDLFTTVKAPARFDVAILLEGTRQASPTSPVQALVAKSVPQTEFLRNLIPHGNWLHLPNGPDYLLSTLPEKACFVFTAGTVSERISQLVQLATHNGRLD